MKAKDLSKEPPRSPHQRVHDYVILARTLDKCRASLNHTLGEYHFDCPLDNLLFEFKGITGAEFAKQVEAGANDEEIGQWLDQHGNVKTAGEISDWSKSLDAYYPYQNDEKREWFIEQCRPLNLNPASTSLFNFLEADDRASFPDFVSSSTDANNWDLPMVETGPEKTFSSIKSQTH